MENREEKEQKGIIPLPRRRLNVENSSSFAEPVVFIEELVEIVTYRDQK